MNNSNLLQPGMTILSLHSRFDFLENASIELILIVVVSLDLQEEERQKRLGMIELLLHVVMGDGLHCHWFGLHCSLFSCSLTLMTFGM